MPKMTAKYSRALAAARQANIEPSNDQEALYARLQAAGYFWESQAKRWEHYAPEEADEPTPLIMIRVWADSEVTEEVADAVIAGAPKAWRLVERSQPFGCRPPKQREARIYLKFLPVKK